MTPPLKLPVLKSPAFPMPVVGLTLSCQSCADANAFPKPVLIKPEFPKPVLMLPELATPVLVTPELPRWLLHARASSLDVSQPVTKLQSHHTNLNHSRSDWRRLTWQCRYCCRCSRSRSFQLPLFLKPTLPAAYVSQTDICVARVTTAEVSIATVANPDIHCRGGHGGGTHVWTCISIPMLAFAKVPEAEVVVARVATPDACITDAAATTLKLTVRCQRFQLATQVEVADAADTHVEAGNWLWKALSVSAAKVGVTEVSITQL